jgi:hypothetical protein
MNTDLAIRKTLTDLVAVYEFECQRICHAYDDLAAAQKALQSAFGSLISAVEGRYGEVERSGEKVIAEITKKAWWHILEMIELRKIASVKRWDEITESIEKGKMPDLTLENVYNLLQAYAQNSGEIVREACLEVFVILTPGQKQSGQGFKTNSRYGVGKTCILPCWVEHSAWGGGFRVNHYRRSDLVQVDRVFHALDGKGVLDGYTSPLCDAIEGCETGSGKTNYFAFNLYQNGNLHLRFLRPDLVAALNALAGDGYSLKV